MRTDSYSIYLRDVRRHAVLSREDEHRLAVLYRQTGSSELAKRLASGHLRLVVKLARRFTKRHGDLLDLIEQGNVGLLLAIRRYDPHRGVRLSSFAAYWIRALILQHLNVNRRLVRVGTTKSQRQLLTALRRAGVGAPETLATPAGMSADDVAAFARHVTAPELGIDAPSFASRLRSPAPAPDVELSDREERRRVREASVAFAKRLAARDRQIFMARWVDDDPPTLAALARRLGVSRERVRQIEQRLLRRFKDYVGQQVAPLGGAHLAAAP